MPCCSTRKEEKNFPREKGRAYGRTHSTRGLVLATLAASRDDLLSLSSVLFPTWQLVEGISTPTAGALRMTLVSSLSSIKYHDISSFFIQYVTLYLMYIISH
jgi:hypothetical protein